MPAPVGSRAVRPLLEGVEAAAGVFGSNSLHEAANRTELEKRRLSGACYACLNGRVQYDVFHLDCRQHGRCATNKQRTDRNLCVPTAIPSKHF